MVTLGVITSFSQSTQGPSYSLRAGDGMSRGSPRGDCHQNTVSLAGGIISSTSPGRVEQVQSIFYILQHSTLILPVSREGEVLLRLLLECLMMGENKKRYIITAYMGRYI